MCIRDSQIRVHCSEKGYPIVGDELYGGGWKKLNEYLPDVKKKINKNVDLQDGHYLHSNRISFLHPRSGKKVFFQADPNESFTNLFKMIKSAEV